MHLAYLLAQANREINRQLEARLRTEGVPVEQWRILKVLSDGNGRSMGELADSALLNHPTLTKTIDRMVADSLVYRISAPADRRKVLIHDPVGSVSYPTLTYVGGEAWITLRISGRPVFTQSGLTGTGLLRVPVGWLES